MDQELTAIAATQLQRTGLPPADEPLTQLQLDILELERACFDRPGDKISEFKQRWPNITQAGYGLALLRLLADPRAYEYDNRRYAATLTRIRKLHSEAEQHRARLRGDVAEQ